MPDPNSFIQRDVNPPGVTALRDIAAARIEPDEIRPSALDVVMAAGGEVRAYAIERWMDVRRKQREASFDLYEPWYARSPIAESDLLVKDEAEYKALIGKRTMKPFSAFPRGATRGQILSKVDSYDQAMITESLFERRPGSSTSALFFGGMFGASLMNPEDMMFNLLPGYAVANFFRKATVATKVAWLSSGRIGRGFVGGLAGTAFQAPQMLVDEWLMESTGDEMTEGQKILGYGLGFALGSVGGVLSGDIARIAQKYGKPAQELATSLAKSIHKRWEDFHLSAAGRKAKSERPTLEEEMIAEQAMRWGVDPIEGNEIVRALFAIEDENGGTLPVNRPRAKFSESQDPSMRKAEATAMKLDEAAPVDGAMPPGLDALREFKAGQEAFYKGHRIEFASEYEKAFYLAARGEVDVENSLVRALADTSVIPVDSPKYRQIVQAAARKYAQEVDAIIEAKIGPVSEPYGDVVRSPVMVVEPNPVEILENAAAEFYRNVPADVALDPVIREGAESVEGIHGLDEARSSMAYDAHMTEVRDSIAKDKNLPMEIKDRLLRDDETFQRIVNKGMKDCLNGE